MQGFKRLVVSALGLVLALPSWAESISPNAVMQTYANIAYATFSDALSAAKQLQSQINTFVTTPSAQTQQAAQQAWLAARKPYSQSEVLRFANPVVDQWEVKVNAWPLDEGLIDYVQSDRYDYAEGNKFAKANIIAGNEPITASLLQQYNEKGGSEANVATGYHAIEFLLWGQDLNQPPNSAGQRPYTDFVVGEGCTHEHCERRGQYLKTVLELLVTELSTIVDQWAEGKDNYRQSFLKLTSQEALRRMWFGMGGLSLGELAGQRLNVALLTHDQEDEHSCFSDNTHDDIVQNIQGILNIFTGTYQRLDGSNISGVSLEQLLTSFDPTLSQQLHNAITTSLNKAQAIAQAAQQGQAFDQQIAADNLAGNERIKATIEALRNQTALIEQAAQKTGITQLNADTMGN